MRTAEDIVRDMGEINNTDKLEFSHGRGRGEYAHAYETLDYETAYKRINGVSGFYMVGFMIGFFASYELHEIPDKWRDTVEQHRKAVEMNGLA